MRGGWAASAELLALSVASAVPAMLQSLRGRRGLVDVQGDVAAAVQALPWLTAAGIRPVKLSISPMIQAIAPTLSTACLLLPAPR